MKRVFFDELELPGADDNLDIGSGSQSEQTGKILLEVEKVLEKEPPEVIHVQGDTNTVLAGALAAAKLHIPIAMLRLGYGLLTGACRRRLTGLLQIIS